MSGEGLPVGETLGRYAPDPRGAPLVTVTLRRLPLQLVTAGREHHDNLMRECRLLALAGEGGELDAPERLVTLVDVLGHQYAAARLRRDQEIDEALQRGELWIDQTTDTPATAAVAVRSLSALLDEADALSERSLLLTTPRPPLLRRFTGWYLGQFVDQIDGRPATPWDGPLAMA